MKNAAKTVTEFLAELPEERREAIRVVRAVIGKNIPEGYVEGFGWGMICWSVPLKAYPDTYNGLPLMYAGLGSQKNHMSLHLLCAYMNPALQKRLADGFRAAGKKLDMGKGCLRFRKLEDLPLEVIADIATAVPMQDYIELARRAHSPEARAKRGVARKAVAKKAVVKQAVAKKAVVKKAVAKRPVAKAARASKK